MEEAKREGGGGSSVQGVYLIEHKITNRFRLQLYKYSTASTANMNVTILNVFSGELLIPLVHLQTRHCRPPFPRTQ